VRDTPRTVLVALFLVQVFFATLHVAGKLALTELSPLALAGTRVLIATPLLLLFAWRHDRTIPARSDWPRIALLGLLGIFANQTLFLLGLQFTTATSSAILMPSIPVFTAGAALVLGVERVRGHRLTGIALAAAGALVLLDPTRLETSRHATVGNLLILGNCLCYSFFLVLLRPLFARIPWRTLIAWSFLFGSLATLFVSAPALAAAPWASLRPATIAAVVYIGLVPTAFNFALNTWAVRRSSPAIVAAFTTLQPLLTTGLAAALLGERLRLHQGLGFLLIVAGLVVVSRRTRPLGDPTAANASSD
jgi:drug/metabolite transporter (DMT)-like permease